MTFNFSVILITLLEISYLIYSILSNGTYIFFDVISIVIIASSCIGIIKKQCLAIWVINIFHYLQLLLESIKGSLFIYILFSISLPRYPIWYIIKFTLPIVLFIASTVFYQLNVKRTKGSDTIYKKPFPDYVMVLIILLGIEIIANLYVFINYSSFLSVSLVCLIILTSLSIFTILKVAKARLLLLIYNSAVLGVFTVVSIIIAFAIFREPSNTPLIIALVVTALPILLLTAIIILLMNKYIVSYVSEKSSI